MLVQSAVLAVDAPQSISAKIRQRAEVLGKPMVGSGRYTQQGRGGERQSRLELKIQSGGKQHSLEQVANRSFLWVSQDLGGNATLSSIDLERVRQALAQSRGSPTAANVWLSIGGLPKLLSSLAASFEFNRVRAAQLDTLAVWQVEGGWRKEALANVLFEKKDQQKARAIDLAKLPKHLPQFVRLTLGRDDLFPYRIEYLQSTQADPKQPDGLPAERALMVMELFEVQLDVAIPSRHFDFRPGNAPRTDQTAALLKSLGLKEKAGTPK
jgi:hypothetical protein